MGGHDLFKVKIEEAKQYMYLTLYVDCNSSQMDSTA